MTLRNAIRELVELESCLDKAGRRQGEAMRCFVVGGDNPAISSVEEARGRLIRFGIPDYARDDIREVLASLYYDLSGKKLHASDCRIYDAPAELPAPCDCEL